MSPVDQMINEWQYEEFKAKLKAWAEKQYDEHYGAQCIIECRDEEDWQREWLAAQAEGMTVDQAVQRNIETADLVAEQYEEVSSNWREF